jgi:hypothetical protein
MILLLPPPSPPPLKLLQRAADGGCRPTGSSLCSFN